MKIMAVMATWHRPELLRRAIRSVKALGWEALVVGSEGDTTRLPSEEEGAHYVEHPNMPLGRKMNAAWLAARQHAPDYVVQWADDGLASRNLMDAYDMSCGLFGFLDMWFWYDGALYYWGGYDKDNQPPRIGEPIGLGRMVRRDVCEALNWAPYGDELKSSLDYSMYTKLVDQSGEGFSGPEIKTCRLADTGVRIVSVKTEESINHMKGFRADASMDALALEVARDDS